MPITRPRGSARNNPTREAPGRAITLSVTVPAPRLSHAGSAPADSCGSARGAEFGADVYEPYIIAAGDTAWMTALINTCWMNSAAMMTTMGERSRPPK